MYSTLFLIFLVEESQDDGEVPVVSISTANVTDFVGNTAVLSCSATGEPAPILTWSKRDGSLPSGMFASNLPVSVVVKVIVINEGGPGSITGPVKSDTASATALHRCDVSS